MTLDEIREIAERFVHLRKMSLGPFDIDVDPVYDYGNPALISSALFAALRVVEMARISTSDLVYMRSWLDRLDEAVAAFDKSIAELKL